MDNVKELNAEYLDFENKNDEVIFFKPSMILRVKSMFIDSLVLVALMYLASLVLNSFNIESGSIRGLFLIIFLYEPIATSLGQTLGQKIMGLRVRRFKSNVHDNQPRNINIVLSLIRFWGKIFLGWISLLTIHTSKYGQAIHDKLSSSIMTLE